MTRVRKSLFFLLIIGMIFLSAGIFCACGKKNDEINITTIGSGKVITQKDGENYLAVPDMWYDFVGWYEGSNKISDKPELKVTSTTPKSIVAKFASSGYQSTDRTLAALYNNYVLGSQMTGDYYNIKTNFQVKYQDENNRAGDNGEFNGFVSFKGEGVKLSFKTSNFEITYTDDTQVANLYVDKNGEKHSYKELSLISTVWKELEDYTQTWTIENVFSQSLKRFFKMNLDYKNTFGIVVSAENSATSTILQLNLNRLLTFLKNNSELVNSNSLFKKVLEILTKHYQQTVIPDIILNYNVEYENKNDKECIKNIKIKIDIPRKYYLTLDEKEVEIPKSTIDVIIENIVYEFGNEAIPEDSFEEYPTPEQRILNFKVDGNMYFKNENEVIDNYSIQLYADLNPTALLIADGDLEKVDWDNLGFLNFKITLTDEESQEGKALQEERHKGSNDYINILIDTKHYGAKALVYVGLYQPESIFTLKYYVNHSYDLKEIANIIPYHESDDALENLKQTKKYKNYIYGLLLNLLNASIKINNGVENDKVITDFILGLLGDKASEYLQNQMTEDEYGKTFNIENLRNKLREYEEGTIKEYMSVYLPIKLDELILGSEAEIIQIAFKCDNIEKNIVICDENGDYFDKNGQNLRDKYNSDHKTILNVTGEFSELAEGNYTIQEIENLKETTIRATEIEYSDGTKASQFTNNKGIDEKIEFLVVKIEIEKIEDGKAQCKLLLQIKDNPKISKTSSLGELLYKVAGIPYGLLTYNIQLQLK